jgi:hypothetical protein
VSGSIPIATLLINQHSGLDRLTPCPTKKKKKKKQGTEKKYVAEEARCAKHTGERGRCKELISLQDLSVNKDWKSRRADSGWVISHCLKDGR